MSAYIQVNIHIVFATKYRHQYLSQTEADQVGGYIYRLIVNIGNTPLAIKCMPDHVHILVRIKSTMSIAELVVKIKSNSSKWINEQNWVSKKFEWQRGYSVFSCGHDRLNRIVHYINNQEEHHQKFNFREEYIRLLEDHEVDYKPEFLFGQRE